jgi:adenylate cyclase
MQKEKFKSFIFSKRNRYIWGLLISASAGLCVCLALGFNLFSNLQLQSNDFFFKAAHYNQSSENDAAVAIVGIDDKSIQELGKYSNWPRSYFATVVDNLAQANPRVIVFDILFSDPDKDDIEFSNSIARAGNVILPVVQTRNAANPLITNNFATYPQILRPLAEIESSAAAIAHANVSTDEDGIVRRLPVILGGGDNDPALSLAAVAKYLRRPQVIESSIVNNQLVFNGRVIPLNQNDEMIINYTTSTNFTAISLVDLLNGNFDAQLLKDKIVLIGATASGLGDYYWTPLGSRMNGVEIHANAINTILSNQFLSPTPAYLNMAIILILAILSGLAVLRFRILWAVLSAGILCLLFFVLVFVGFDKGLIINPTFPPLAIAFSFVGTSLFKLAAEQSKKNQITRLFGRYVSTSVADNVIRALDQGKLELEGKEQEITVLFADVRNFTKLTQQTSPIEMVKALNVYLSIVIRCVLKYGGMVNKFNGDSIMAVWNAPVVSQNHAASAVKAAMEAQLDIEEVRVDNPALLEMHMGIGINSGIAVAGNMGSKERMEYSVIGDTVNMASRIADSAPGGEILIGETTFSQVAKDVKTRSSSLLEVKGKSEPIRVYRVTGANWPASPT